jgi:AcrR family transcriptional regulator
MTTKDANATKDTSEQILEAALTLFRERGFASATMRDIAAKAGVASGLAYYYFDSKEAIVLAFYQRARADMASLLERAHQERALSGRLQALVEAKFSYFKPNRRFLGAILGHAADPASPLSPFNEASRPIREFEFAQFDRALRETKTKVPADLAPHLAKMLWFYQMGLLLFWIHDRSPEQRRSHELLAASLRAVIMLIKLSNIPLFKPARRSALTIIELLDA